MSYSSSEVLCFLLFFALRTIANYSEYVKMDIENKSTATTTVTWNSIEAATMEINRYYIPIFISLSLLGNSLSVCVFCRTKLRYLSSSIYLSALAISDNGVLVTIIISTLITYLTNKAWGIAFRLCMQTFFAFISVWLVVAFTVERYVAIRWPLLRRSLCTIARAKIVVTGLMGIAVFITIPWFFFMLDIYLHYYNKTSGTFDADKNYKSDWILRIMSMIIMFLLPFIMIVIFNILIVYNICKQNHVQKNLFTESQISSEWIQVFSNEAQNKITKMLILVSSTFICFNTPIYICWFFNDYYMAHRPIWHNVAWKVSDLLWMMSYGINFVLYYASGHNFRSALIRMFTSRYWKKPKSDTDKTLGTTNRKLQAY